MPIYEYHCKACDHREEVLQKMSDDPLTQCLSCGAEKFTKLVSASGFRLKGQGWYETDFKGGGGKNIAGSSSSSSKKSSDT